MDQEENKVIENNTTTVATLDKNESASSPVSCLDCCELPGQSSSDVPQNEVSSKRISSEPESNDLSAASDELPVKRVRVDNSEDGCEVVKVDVKDRIVSSSEPEVKRDITPTTGKTAPKSTNLHQVKWVEWDGGHCPIITQNENGPCPLIAIVNILLMRKIVSVAEGTTEISAEKLIDYVKSALGRNVPKDCDPNHFQNTQDALEELPRLQTGLNVNIKFNGVKNFEYTTGCIIFDLLDIHLYHGWLPDPQLPEASIFGSLSYNQAVEMIIKKEASTDPIELRQAEAAEQFLESTATQLTCHGLCELNAEMEKGEMAVLFRNNHFSVIYKHKESLYQLVTDQGYLEEKRVVWETLSTIDGDEIFLDGKFQSLLPKEPPLNVDEEQQISEDFCLALSLQDEQDKQLNNQYPWIKYDNAPGVTTEIHNAELAETLFYDGQRMAQASVSTVGTVLNSHDDRVEGTERRASPVSPQHIGPQIPRGSEECPKDKDWKCTIY